ncbi:MAG: tRNA pseudouridine(55) synthase TruB [Spirochaetes bacterium]|nr:tRNA pseudouridine(55) synthase TruB [Spirochaetota bacterium]
MVLSELNDSILLIDKESGITSFGVVSRLKRILGLKKIGHAGTLDKAATGLLVIGTGKATRLLKYFLESDKTYVAEIQFGTVTDTCDREGNVVKTADISGLTETLIRSAVSSFIGNIRQMPPVFSALKVNGRRASDLVRDGIDVELKSRDIVVHNIDIMDVDVKKGSLKLKVWCSKGTYIRSLARDIGEKTGTGGYMTDLRRVASGFFNIEDAVTLDKLEYYKTSGFTNETVFHVRPGSLFRKYSHVVLKEGCEKTVLNGVKFKSEDISERYDKQSPFYAVFSSAGDLIAVAEIDFSIFRVNYLNVFNN